MADLAVSLKILLFNLEPKHQPLVIITPLCYQLVTFMSTFPFFSIKSGATLTLVLAMRDGPINMRRGNPVLLVFINVVISNL